LHCPMFSLISLRVLALRLALSHVPFQSLGLLHCPMFPLIASITQQQSAASFGKQQLHKQPTYQLNPPSKNFPSIPHQKTSYPPSAYLLNPVVNK
jgi:hypothetical protein